MNTSTMGWYFLSEKVSGPAPTPPSYSNVTFEGNQITYNGEKVIFNPFYTEK